MKFTKTAQREVKKMLNSHDIKIPKSLEKVLSARIGTEYLYDHPEIYDLAYAGQKGDISFYQEYAKKGKVLYLGVGSGRIYLNLVKKNNTVTGLDYSKSMIERMYKKMPTLKKNQLIFANVLDAKIKPESYDVIIAPFCFLNQFDEDKVIKILNNCKKWVRPGGKIITDFFSPFHNPAPPKNFVKAFKKRGGNLKVELYEYYDFIKQRLYELTVVHKSDHHYVAQLNLHYYYPSQILSFSNTCGLNVEGLWGDFTRKPISTSNKVIALVLRKNGSVK